jgi:hypothetical protein
MDWEVAKARYVLDGEITRAYAALGQRWNDIFAQETMHVTYAGKERHFVAPDHPRGEPTLGGTKEFWTEKPFAARVAELQTAITNMGKRVDRMTEDKQFDLYHPRQLELEDLTPFEQATVRMAERTQGRPPTMREVFAEHAAALRAQGKDIDTPTQGKERGLGR